MLFPNSVEEVFYSGEYFQSLQNFKVKVKVAQWCLTLQGIFPTQGSNPCLLHWQAGSLPLSHQGSPACKVAPYKLSIVSIILKPNVQLVAEQSLFTDGRSFLPPPSQQPQLLVPSVWLLPYLPMALSFVFEKDFLISCVHIFFLWSKPRSFVSLSFSMSFG